MSPEQARGENQRLDGRSDVEALADDVRRYLRGEPTLARPDTLRRRPARGMAQITALLGDVGAQAHRIDTTFL